MRYDRICLLCAAFFAVSAPSPAWSTTAYDGIWQVTITTHTGTCEPSARYPVTVTDGRVSSSAASVSGSVGASGNVKVSIGPAYANGQLNARSGSGKWNGASGGVPCSGRWEASRQ